jgi:hypothetical protein
VPKIANQTHRRSSLSTHRTSHRLSSARARAAPQPTPAASPKSFRSVLAQRHPPHPPTPVYATLPPSNLPTTTHTQCSEVRRAPYTAPPPSSSRQQLGSERQRKSKANTPPHSTTRPLCRRAGARIGADCVGYQVDCCVGRGAVFVCVSLGFQTRERDEWFG